MIVEDFSESQTELLHTLVAHSRRRNGEADSCLAYPPAFHCHRYTTDSRFVLFGLGGKAPLPHPFNCLAHSGQVLFRQTQSLSEIDFRGCFDRQQCTAQRCGPGRIAYTHVRINADRELGFDLVDVSDMVTVRNSDMVELVHFCAGLERDSMEN